MKDSKISKQIKSLSKGVICSVGDLLLYCFYLTGSSFFTANSSSGINTAFSDADELLKQLNTRTITEALFRIKKNKRYVQYKESKNQKNIAITDLGRKRINEITPEYHPIRPWDHKLYIVSYDIPEKKRRIRSLLRFNLEKIGAVIWQKSLWFSPYDPRGALKTVINDYSLENYLIIASIDQTISFSKSSLELFLTDIYRLANLGKRYQDFIDNCSDNKQGIGRYFTYISILKDDPQLPFELEPKWFGIKEKKAQQLFKNNFF